MDPAVKGRKIKMFKIWITGTYKESSSEVNGDQTHILSIISTTL